MDPFYEFGREDEDEHTFLILSTRPPKRLASPVI